MRQDASRSMLIIKNSLRVENDQKIQFFENVEHWKFYILVFNKFFVRLRNLKKKLKALNKS